MNEGEKRTDKKLEPLERKIFPFKAKITGPTQATFEIGGLNAPVYELTEGHVTGEIQMKDGFPVENVQVHDSVSIDSSHLERLLLLLRQNAYQAYEDIRIRTGEGTSPLGLSARALQSGNIQFVNLQQEQRDDLPQLKPPPWLE